MKDESDYPVEETLQAYQQREGEMAKGLVKKTKGGIER